MAVLCSLRAQSLSNLRTKSVVVQGDSLKVDSMALVPGQFFVYQNGVPLDTSAYTLFPFQSLLLWKKAPQGEVRIKYRVYPFKRMAAAAHKSHADYSFSQQNFVMHPFEYKPLESPQQFIDFGTLDYNGTFSRGLTFGSNQDVVLNSQFNLQLSGALAKDLEITAALTDNNVPFQPDGNTQQIQEFDKIFIQLKYRNHKLTAGDFDLYNPESSYFLRYSKKPQGGWYQGSFDFKKWGNVEAQAAGGIMRGKFARNVLQVSEGNQGPYKLLGANGETYIVILANSEEVFINGKKMQRGADRDYVIDYNTAEIKFTPKRIITRDLRVVVEFEYTNNNYLRSVIFANAAWETKHVNTRINIYSEQDSKSQTLSESLDDKKRDFLSSIGDSVTHFLYPTLDSVAANGNRVLYALKDTLGFDSVLVYETSSNAYYTATFSLVGEGKGDYIPASSTANGRVFAWVKPDTVAGVIYKRGSYVPAVLLPAPQLQQLFSIANDFKINSNHVISTEAALSNRDVNTLSALDNDDNRGGAARINYKGIVPTKRDSSRVKEQLLIDAAYEFVQAKFKYVERFRAVEFNREWNTAAFENPRDEHYGNLFLQYQFEKAGNIYYRFRNYIQQGNFSGYENSIGATLQGKGFLFSTQNSVMNSDAPLQHSLFIRPRADLSYAVKKAKNISVGVYLDHEVNSITNKATKHLQSNSYLWQNYGIYLKSPDSMRNQFTLEAKLRMEQRADSTAFAKPFFYGQSVSTTGRITTLKNQALNWTATYRYAFNSDSIHATNYNRHYYLGRIDYSITALKGFLRSTTLYEISSGREQKIQVSYQQSPTNTGDYIWKDANDDGIKQLDEFVVSPFKEDTTYIKVFTVTPESLPVNVASFTQTLNVNPATLLGKNASRAARFFAKFSAFASIEVQRKSFASKSSSVANVFNPFPVAFSNPSLVSLTHSSRASLFFNRLDPKYGLQFDFSYLQSKILLTNGYEERLTQTQSVSARYNFIKSLTVQTVYTNGTRANTSDFYIQQRYRFYFNQTNTELSYQYKTAFRIAVNYLFAQKINPTDSVGNQIVNIHQAGLQSRYNISGKAAAEARFTYSLVHYADKDYRNQQLEYAMLEGLQNGNNLVWNGTVEYRLTPAVLLTFVYDGRKTGTAKVVHSGRAELRAIF
ncbi:MAG: hypothetical protein U0T72_07550 [Chitinophagales bacterium]